MSNTSDQCCISPSDGNVSSLMTAILACGTLPNNLRAKAVWRSSSQHSTVVSCLRMHGHAHPSGAMPDISSTVPHIVLFLYLWNQSLWQDYWSPPGKTPKWPCNLQAEANIWLLFSLVLWDQAWMVAAQSPASCYAHSEQSHSCDGHKVWVRNNPPLF